MRIIDPLKQPEIQHMILCDLLADSWSNGGTVHVAAERIVESFGYSVERFRCNGWYAVALISFKDIDERELYSQHGDFDRCADIDVEDRDYFVASSLVLAEIAALISVVDPGAKVWYDDDSVIPVYSAEMVDAARELVWAAKTHIRQLRWFGDFGQGYNWDSWTIDVWDHRGWHKAHPETF